MGNIKKLHDGREVDSASEEWRAECEAAYLLDHFKNRQARNDFLYGIERKGAGGRMIVEKKGISHTRGQDAADKIKAHAMRIFEHRENNKKQSTQ